MKKIGIFGGTFDPLHHGHLILARESRERLGLDTVIFVPASASPHKTGQPLTPARIRWMMLLAALEGEPGLECSEVDLERPPPSYAIDTVELFISRHPSAQFYYIIGQDNLSRLPTWHRFDELSKMVQFVLLSRSGISTGNPYPVIRRQLDISATNIRNRIASGLSIRYLVPAAVAEIIRDYQLYTEPEP